MTNQIDGINHGSSNNLISTLADPASYKTHKHCRAASEEIQNVLNVHSLARMVE